MNLCTLSSSVQSGNWPKNAKDSHLRNLCTTYWTVCGNVSTNATHFIYSTLKLSNAIKQHNFMYAENA